jgi:spermidine synthase
MEKYGMIHHFIFKDESTNKISWKIKSLFRLFKDNTMKPTVKLATALTPDGGDLVLYQHGRDFSIKINNQDLMNSRQHESELALARLGCAHLAGHKAPNILIGGLGLGYTLREALDMLSPSAQVVVSELLGAVVEWNREFFGELNGRPLEDNRVDLKMGNIVDLISNSRSRFDAILLDIDNGPNAMTDSGNRRLYGREGIRACRRALREQGCLAVWSAEPSKKFEQLLITCSFHVRRFRVSAYKGSKSQSRFVWVASEDKLNLPRGGGEPHRPLTNAHKGEKRKRNTP